MSNPLVQATLVLAMLGLAACSERKVDPPLPAAQTSQPAVPSVADPSVPSAASVTSPPTTPTARDAAAGGTGGTMTKAQESSAMPMPGQVNNHSTTALDPVKRGASAP